MVNLLMLWGIDQQDTALVRVCALRRVEDSRLLYSASADG